MALIKLFIASTLDGYIARPDGNLDWLLTFPNPNKIDHDYNTFLSTIGATIMGSATYREVLGFGIDWPYPDIPSYIVTRNHDLPVSSPMTERITGDIKSFAEELKSRIEKDIWLMGGGQLITSFLNNDLVDEMTLTLIPTILGEGIQLFPGKPPESNWQLIEAKSFETGAVNLIYRRK